MSPDPVMQEALRAEQRRYANEIVELERVLYDRRKTLRCCHEQRLAEIESACPAPRSKSSLPCPAEPRLAWPCPAAPGPASPRRAPSRITW